MIIRSNTKQAIDQYQEKCPFCLNVLNQPILTYIDCDKQPDLKYEAICGHLLHSRCPHCGSQIPLSQSLTYEDKLNHTILYFEPDDQKRSSLNKTLQKKISERKIRFKKTFYRILKRREDFYEKSRILDCSLDDRLIELMKIYIVQFFLFGVKLFINILGNQTINS
ncbi:CpXC domain-containing protein, partial [Ileibacterium valens]|uniref:CpXC domain-containing protein n=1 Tax=Ileibacterium valens TaxID=1862668 RepID=UPI00257238C2